MIWHHGHPHTSLNIWLQLILFLYSLIWKSVTLANTWQTWCLTWQMSSDRMYLIILSVHDTQIQQVSKVIVNTLSEQLSPEHQYHINCTWVVFIQLLDKYLHSTYAFNFYHFIPHYWHNFQQKLCNYSSRGHFLTTIVILF